MKPEQERCIPLVVVAYERKGYAGFYRGARFYLAITGVLEHNVSAAMTLTPLRLERQIS